MNKKTYNKDETMKLLLDAVGEVLKEHGHAGIGVNKIANQAGVSKSLIYRYYLGLNNLLMAYIERQDYWLPIFRNLTDGERPAPDELQTFYTEILQEQFKFFRDNEEMQKFILWQISEPHALLRSVSNQREEAGEKLLALSDPHFKDSGISFRAVTGLIIGGLYYMVLHAGTNKSKVSGIDINEEKDRAIILKTVGQLIGWAWQAAETKAV